MEQIKYILHKLEELNNQNEKSIIDYDLMLDYTKKMYEFILEQKRQPLDIFTASGVTAPSWNANSVNENKHTELVSTSIENTTTPGTPSETASDFIPDTIETINTPVEGEPTAELEPIPELTESTATLPENEDAIASSHISDKAIVFELPSAAISIELPQTEAPTPFYENETATKPTTIEADIEEDTVLFQDSLKTQPLTGQGFIAPVHQKQKDIRKSIGVNDQYLFINELFQNDKGSYDLAISTINNLNSYADARNWIEDHVSFPLSWDKEDPTVASFYQLIENHFNSK